MTISLEIRLTSIVTSSKMYVCVCVCVCVCGGGGVLLSYAVFSKQFMQNDNLKWLLILERKQIEDMLFNCKHLNLYCKYFLILK